MIPVLNCFHCHHYHFVGIAMIAILWYIYIYYIYTLYKLYIDTIIYYIFTLSYSIICPVWDRPSLLHRDRTSPFLLKRGKPPSRRPKNCRTKPIWSTVWTYEMISISIYALYICTCIDLYTYIYIYIHVDIGHDILVYWLGFPECINSVWASQFYPLRWRRRFWPSKVRAWRWRSMDQLKGKSAGFFRKIHGEIHGKIHGKIHGFWFRFFS